MTSDKTLGRARGLNSIADPAQFKGTRGRRTRRGAPSELPGPAERPTASPASPASAARPDRAGAPDSDIAPTASPERSPATPSLGPTPHRAVVPGVQRKRRELSVPIPVAEAVEATGINAADVVMTAYRQHSDAIFNGAGGRMVARGRQRLRLSISDGEFDKLTRLGESRGWNRSETVTVLLTLALLSDESA